jgi:hypothetical protein
MDSGVSPRRAIRPVVLIQSQRPDVSERDMQGLTQNVTVGSWYRVGTEPPFEIVALDVDHETIEVQYADGTLEEIDFDSWAEMEPHGTHPPEDWSGSMDVGREEFGIEPDTMHMESWDSPLDHLDQYG